jgi:secretion/DNA translocation related TadE-like protein
MIDWRRGCRSRDLPRCGRAGEPRWPRRALDERGSASLLVALWSAVLTLLAVGGVVVSSALSAREAVSAAADLAALAGASLTLTDPGRSCAVARVIARENGASLSECRVQGTGVWVVARTPAPRPVQWLVPGRGPHLGARAHAELTAEDP